MLSEISYDEFQKDLRQQGRGREVERPPWKAHPEALSRSGYDRLTQYGRSRPERPRPVWLSDKRRWTVGAPVNPVEWQILIQSEPAYGRVNEISVARAIKMICGQFRLSDYAFSEYVSRLHRRGLLRIRGGFRRSKIADKWLFPDLTGARAGGEWHRNRIHDYIDEVNRLYGCYTYADRGYYPGIEMPDVITVRPQIMERATNNNPQAGLPEWDWENPIYAEFKSARDMRRYPSRLKKQLERYEGVPLFLKVEAKVGEAKDMLEDRGRQEVDLLDLLRKGESDTVYLTGSERPRSERLFEPVLDRIREAFLETYDKKARLRKTGTDPQGREHHDLILYDALNTPKNVGQVIPNYADDVEDFADLYFDRKHLGHITTADYIYVPERKPTCENKTWRWDRRKTQGSRFRSFSA